MEIIIAIAIGTIVFLSIQSYLDYSLKVVNEDVNKTEALYLAKSSIEEARSVRDEKSGSDYQYGWDLISPPNITLGSQYNFQSDGLSPAKWVIQSGSKTAGKYTVWVVFSAVNRDASDNIVSSGGSLDEETLKITSYVSWAAGSATKQVSLSEYLTNFR